MIPPDESREIIENLVNVLGANHEALIRRVTNEVDADSVVQLINALMALPPEIPSQGDRTAAWDDLARVCFHQTDRYRDNRLKEPLLLLLENSAGYASDLLAADALGISGDWSIEPNLRAALDKRHHLQNAAANALIVLLYGEMGESACIKALQDDHAHVRYVAAQYLESLSATEALIAAIQNSNERVRRIAVWYVGRRVINDAFDMLIGNLNDTDLEALRGTIWSLGMLHNPQAIPALQPLTQHPDPLIARTAAEAIERLK